MAGTPIKKCNTCGREFLTENDFLKGTSRWRLCERGNLWFNCQCNSTNMIVKGKFPWYSPDLFMSARAKSLFNTLPGLRELPHMPTVVMELQQLLLVENVSSSQIAAVSKRDPIIASNILKIANNLKAELEGKIDSLEHAISYIGFRALSDIIVTASVSSFKFKTTIFNADEFWQECFLTGKIAEFLSVRYAKHIVPDEAYLAGALCNVGKVVLAICFPDQADTIALDTKDVKLLKGWRQSERQYECHDHCTLGEIAGAFWGLPEYVMSASANHHKVPESPSPRSHLAMDDIVRFANQLAHWVLLEPCKIESYILNYSSRIFGLNHIQVDQLAEELSALAPKSA